LPGHGHAFQGLAYGNKKAMHNKGRLPNPAKAARQVWAKVEYLRSRGLRQEVIPPHIREAEELGSSEMWRANAATVSPSTDTADHKVHITPANLQTHAHRRAEVPETAQILKQIFPSDLFTHHPPLVCNELYFDEGAANHMRLEDPETGEGLHIFAYGCSAKERTQIEGFPVRQTYEASEKIATQHQLNAKQVRFWQQDPASIQAGAFHTDVLCMSNEQLLICHAQAFASLEYCLEGLPSYVQSLVIAENILPLDIAIDTYFFNSQLLTLPEGGMLLLLPQECAEHPLTLGLAESFVSDPDLPITELHYVDLSESMRNGGGPACLRLRVPLTAEESAVIASLRSRCGNTL